MVAVVLLAICAVPMADAISNGLAASTVGVDKARELRCVKNTMESVLAEPYRTLWDAARGRDAAAAYVLAEDASCAGVPRELVIGLCESPCEDAHFAQSNWVLSRRESALLYIKVKSNKGYFFETLVSP